MKVNNGCDLEPRIILALETNGISDNVRQHISDCETCRDTVIAGDWMKKFAATPLEEGVLPKPAIIWLQSQLMQQRSALGTLAQAMSWGQTIAFGALAFAWAVLLSWKWSALETLAGAVRSGEVVWSVLQGAVHTPVVLTVVMLTCATIALAFQSVLLEE
jgi:hypothetical protein